jgi:ribonuclease R
MARRRKRNNIGKPFKKTSDEVVGVIRRNDKGYAINFIGKRYRDPISISNKEINGAREGDVVRATITRASRDLPFSKARVKKIIGREDDPSIISLISAYEINLSQQFSHASLKSADSMTVPKLGNREDLRDIPLVTIDGPDARDFDDAVYAKRNKNGGHDLIVAIADVAHYVKAGDDLDKEAFLRGNSTYFPDRVYPMLPEKLSNGLCSLKPDEDRACVAVHMHINKDGELKDFRFARALMKSKARLTYEQVQNARDGKTDKLTAPIKKSIIDPLYEAYEALTKARKKRGTLDFNMTEQKVIIDDKGNMTGIKNYESYDSNKVIEEFMIIANVAAATELENKNKPCVYRIHEAPFEEKLAPLKEFIENCTDISWPKKEEIDSNDLRKILEQASGSDQEQLIKSLTLRAQTKAIYNPNNIGHFGLSLERYAHFTSPIRRYADLIDHRSIVGELTNVGSFNLDKKSEHISKQERDSKNAERRAQERFAASYLSKRIGEEFEGRISGVTAIGLFVRLNDSGSETLLPSNYLPGGKYYLDRVAQSLVEYKDNGRGRSFRMGDEIKVKIKKADILKGRVISTHVKAAKAMNTNQKPAP